MFAYLQRDGRVFTSVIIDVFFKGLVCFNVVLIGCMLFLADFLLLYCNDLHFFNLFIMYLFKFILYVGLLIVFCFCFCFLFCFVRSHLFLYWAYLKDGHVLLIFHLCLLFSRLSVLRH